METTGKYEYMNENSIDEQLKCTLCNAPFVDPISTPCLHAFCRRCINDRFIKKPSCSICSRSLSKNDLMPMALFVCNILDRLPVKCVACGQTEIKRSEFANHIDEICPKTLVPCTASDIRCPWMGRAKQLKVHIASCGYEPIRSVLAELIVENNSLKKKIGQGETQIKVFEGKTERFNCQDMEHMLTITQLTDEVNFMKEMVCHRNEKLEQEIDGYMPNSWIDLRKVRTRIVSLDMGIVVQKAVIDKQCTELQLQGNQITDRGISILVHGLQHNTTMIKLNLSHNPITDVGVHLLANLLSENKTKIKKLHLADTETTDEGAHYLAEMLMKNTTLTSLSIFENRIGDRGVQKLTDVLTKHNTSLNGLYLQSNSLVTDASIDGLIEMLNRNSSLTALDLKQCGLTLAGIHRLQQVASKKENFSLTT